MFLAEGKQLGFCRNSITNGVRSTHVKQNSCHFPWSQINALSMHLPAANLLLSAYLQANSIIFVSSPSVSLQHCASSFDPPRSLWYPFPMFPACLTPSLSIQMPHPQKHLLVSCVWESLPLSSLPFPCLPMSSFFKWDKSHHTSL